MILAARLFTVLYRELSARPLLAFTIATTLASFITAYASERERINALISETIRDLNERADEIEARAAYAATGENFADFDADRWKADGEIARRLYGEAPIEPAAGVAK